VKLEPAFLAGLRCVQPAIRAKFFEVFDASMKRRLHDRLMYITCSQNWEAMGPHYWIKQCIELLVVTASSSKTFCYLYEMFVKKNYYTNYHV
jgi:transformation/transcription domain-associated protein